jgi:hypothetical protein
VNVAVGVDVAVAVGVGGTVAVGVAVAVAVGVGVGEPAGQAPGSETTTVSILQPCAVEDVSLPMRQRNTMFCPAANGGRFTVVVKIRSAFGLMGSATCHVQASTRI